jgi:hypothetical protein
VFGHSLELGLGAIGFASAELDFMESTDTRRASGTRIDNFDPVRV